jgi:hypothetical protein
VTKTEQAKRDIHRIMGRHDLSYELKKARQESGLDSHPFYALVKELLVDLDDDPDTGLDEVRQVFDELIDSPIGEGDYSQE